MSSPLLYYGVLWLPMSTYTYLCYNRDMDYELCRELYDYHTDGYLIARRKLSGRCPKGARIGYRNELGYITTSYKGVRYRVHRLIYIWHHGNISEEVHHENNIRDDNRIENLREVTRQENQLHRIDSKKNGGIRYHKRQRVKKK